MLYSTRQQAEIVAKLLLTLAEEEEISIYGMSTLSKNQNQLRLFGPDQKKVEEILNTLIQDTKKHERLLSKAADLIIKGMV